MKVRRRQHCIIEIGDLLLPDLSALLNGSVTLTRSVAITLLCQISGRRIPLTPEALALMAALPGDAWTDVGDLEQRAGCNAALLGKMIEDGIVLCDAPDGASAALLDGQATLDAIGWHPLASVYHRMTAWSGITGDEGSREHGNDAERARLDKHIAAHGALPPHFPKRHDALAHLQLPASPLQGEMADVLQRRRTTRHFDRTRPLPMAALARVLFGTFGAMGVEEIAPGHVAVRRTSPSGGALHPIEAYPLIMDVEGVAPGFYHYESDTHRLAKIIDLSASQARTMASDLTIGQHYFADSSALVFHVARLDRHHWKYRRHPKAYKAVLLDSGHLSQTFYLLAAESGLGAFYTAAINDTDAGRLLALDPLATMVIGANGVGNLDATKSTLHLNPRPLHATNHSPGQ
ncbi:putative peptide maturation dehydrogenase [Xanthomonas sacchari]|uniref:putative peptide maturation dehydrogenase n=1 Tax=Xanthomonas sacchari TaxID=56458 RepID=UPI00277DB5AE|nr:putative peptide maturation dehydrogenase [Xanthomonas sacchari]MDQ1091408.1 putative peptide maturation dehydrogenase [Xanthomonas sacchari]